MSNNTQQRHARFNSTCCLFGFDCVIVLQFKLSRINQARLRQIFFKLIQYLSCHILLTTYECAHVEYHLQSSITNALIREQAHFRSLPTTTANVVAIAISSIAPSIHAWSKSCFIYILPQKIILMLSFFQQLF